MKLNKLFLIIFVNILLLVTLSSFVSADSYFFQPNATNGTDTYVAFEDGDTNRGTQSAIFIAKEYYQLFNFNFTCDSIPIGEIINNVTLELTFYAINSVTPTVIYAINHSWGEHIITWNNCGVGYGCLGWYNTTYVLGSGQPSGTGKYNFTINTTWYQAECAKPSNQRYGMLLLTGTDGTNSGRSSDYVTNTTERPALYVETYVSEPPAPQINVLFPDTTYNETYNFNLWINFTTDEATTCFLNDTAFEEFSSNGTYFSYNESTLDDNFYAVNISCNDTSDNWNSTIVYFTKDLEIPVITSILPLEDNTTSYNNTGTVNISFSLSDNIDLFVYNLSIFELDPEVLVFNISAEISGTSYLFSQLINTTGWDGFYKQTVRTCDSHTKMLIKEAEEIVKEYDTLKFQFDDINVDIKSIGGNEISTDTVKLKDRYTFKFNYDKVTSFKVYELTSSHKITYLPKSSFKGHFVLGNTLWVDFSNDGKVTVEKSDGNYLITVENLGQSIEFSSIGYLNCVEEHYQFELIGTCENVTCTVYDSCQPDVSGGLQDCIAVNETEECFYEGNYTEFQSGCDYCTPILDTNVFCAVWSGICPTNYSEYCSDINNTCYNETGSETDIYGAVTRGCVGTYSSGNIPEVTIDVIVGTIAVIFSLVGIIALVLIFGWVIKKWKER